MKDVKKYQGIFPAFYACYDAKGAIDPTAVREMTRWLIRQGVHGVYVGGSSGECIYQSVAERKLLLENVMAEAKGKLVVIAHVAAQHVVSGQFVVALRGTAIVGAAQQDDAVASRSETELLTRRVGRHTVAQRGAEREALVQVPLQVQAEGGEGIDVDVEVVVEGRVAAVTGVGKEAREFGVEVMLVGLQQSGEHLQPAFPRLAQPCVHQAGGAAFRVDRGEILPHVDQLRSYVPGGQSARLGLCPLPQWHGQAGIEHAVPGRGRVLEAALPLRE